MTSINNFIRDKQRFISPEFSNTLKLQEKDDNEKPISSKIPTLQINEYKINRINLPKPKFKEYHLERVNTDKCRNYKVVPFTMRNFNDNHLQNKIHGIPDIKIKQESPDILTELETNGMTDKDFAMSNLLKENGSLDTFGLKLEGHINGSSLDDAKTKFMTQYETKTLGKDLKKSLLTREIKDISKGS